MIPAWCLYMYEKNKTNHPMSSNSHSSATANKSRHYLNWGGGGGLQNQREYQVIRERSESSHLYKRRQYQCLLISPSCINPNKMMISLKHVADAYHSDRSFRQPVMLILYFASPLSCYNGDNWDNSESLMLAAAYRWQERRGWLPMCSALFSATKANKSAINLKIHRSPSTEFMIITDYK